MDDRISLSQVPGVPQGPAATVGVRTKCPKCGCPFRVPPATGTTAARSPFASLRSARARPRPGRPWAKALLVLGLVAIASVLYLGLSLGGWLNLKDSGTPDDYPEAHPKGHDQPADDHGKTPPAKQPDPAPVKPPDPAPPKPPDPAPVKPPDPPPVKPPDPAPPKPPPPPADGSLKRETHREDDLKVTTLNLPQGVLLPCLLWANEEGSAFFALQSDTGVLRRISFPELEVTDKKDLDRKFAWMSLSREGLLLSQPDSEKIWVVDPDTLEVKSKIAVPGLKRAASAPGLSWAVACDQGSFQTQKLYVVDLKRQTADRWDVPQGAVSESHGLRLPGNSIGVNNPAVTPDGAFVFTGGDNPAVLRSGLTALLREVPALFRFSFRDGKPTYEEATRPSRFQAGGGPAGITFSPDSKWVCLPDPNAGDRFMGQLTPTIATAIYPVDRLSKPHCTLEQGGMVGGMPTAIPQAVGFDLKARYLYTQNLAHELIVFSLHGVKKKEYRLANPPGSVRHYLVHPDGNRVVLLTRPALDAVEVPGKWE